MDLFEIHNRINLILSKKTGDYFAPGEIDDLLDMAQMQEFNLLIENSRELPNPRIGYARTRSVHEDLMPFFSSVTLDESTNLAASGVHKLPANVGYVTGVRKGDKQVDILSEDKIAARLGSEIVRPTDSKPVAMMAGFDGSSRLIELFPITASGVTVYFLYRPSIPTLAYTQVERVLAYDPDGSIQLKWSDRVTERIIQRALSMAGLNLDDYNLAQYNDQKQQTGA